MIKYIKYLSVKTQLHFDSRVCLKGRCVRPMYRSSSSWWNSKNPYWELSSLICYTISSFVIMYWNIHFDTLLILRLGMHLLFGDRLFMTAVVRGKPLFFHLNFWIVCSFLFVPSLVAFIYMCVCMCVCVCVCVCVYIYIHTHTHTYIKSHTSRHWLTFISHVLCYCSGIYAVELAGCYNVAMPKYPSILSQPVATHTRIVSIAEHSSTSCFPAVSYV
jgi:hypothetical protein